MAGTINNVGQFIGIPLGGLLADKYIFRRNSRYKKMFIYDVLLLILDMAAAQCWL